uniref:Uncharacterized protein n=1 Tax=Pristionchus pacificus TaxID=54126 RepID=A0A2A6CVW1_PRIPA|eukprot:PDM82056.1 hypothetical protein PRIPAC_36449 [Pristionchus pacificus]
MLIQEEGNERQGSGRVDGKGLRKLAPRPLDARILSECRRGNGALDGMHQEVGQIRSPSRRQTGTAAL